MSEDTNVQYNAAFIKEKESVVLPLTAAQRRLQRAAMQLFAEKGVTRVTVAELAQAAGIARGTIYNNVQDVGSLFSEVATQLAEEMLEVTADLSARFDNSAQRLANGIRYFVKQSHEDPLWGRFVCRFALSTESLQKMWTGQPLKDLSDGLETGRFTFQRDQLPSAVSLIAGAVLGAATLVLDGRRTWRDAGSDAAEFVLVALGVPREEARTIARMELPDAMS